MREKMGETRMGVSHKGVIHSAEYGRVKFFLTANRYADGRFGEVFITCDASGSTLDGFCDAWATAISMLLQHGETVESLARKFAHVEFEPKGMTESTEVRFARSVPDYVMRWLAGQWAQKPGNAAAGGAAATEPGDEGG
jgi:ribonucleoside-diphosphate reductase alpha chain